MPLTRTSTNTKGHGAPLGKVGQKLHGSGSLPLLEPRDSHTLALTTLSRAPQLLLEPYETLRVLSETVSVTERSFYDEHLSVTQHRLGPSGRNCG